MALPHDHVRALNDLRQRLRMLAENLHNLDAQLQNPNNPLPAWPSLSSSARLLANNLAQLQDLFTTHSSFLKTAHAYPHASYPVTEDFLLQQLLRKKLHPVADEWVEEHAKAYDGGGGGLGMAEQRELWTYAKPMVTGVGEGMRRSGLFHHGFTLAEREGGVQKVRTGLRRRLDPKLRRRRVENGKDEGSEDDEEEEEGDDEQDGEEEMAEDEMVEDVMPAEKLPGDVLGDEDIKGLELGRNALPVEAVMRFMCMGMMPQR